MVTAVREAAAGGSRRGEHRFRLLEVINKVGAALLSPASLDEVLNQVLDLIFEAVEAERAYLLLRRDDGEIVCRVARFRDGAAVDDGDRISRSIIDRVIASGEPMLTSDAQQDARFRDRQSIVLTQVRSAMAAPLAIDGRALGLIYVDTPATAGAFTEDDLEMLQTVAAVSAIKLENALLVEERLENERLRLELAGAREIQQRLLPAEPPAVDGYDLAGLSTPFGEVGGDAYDFIVRPDGRLLVTIGDVVGKGLDAALLAASASACLRAYAASPDPLGEVVARLNRSLCTSCPANRFVTFFAAELDPAAHRLSFVNAGHPPALAVAPGGVRELEAPGLPLGIDAAAVYEQREVTLAAGEAVLVFSDGVSEATAGDGRELGTKRLAEAVARAPGATAWELVQLLDDSVRCFLEEMAPADDMTLVVLARKG